MYYFKRLLFCILILFIGIGYGMYSSENISLKAHQEGFEQLRKAPSFWYVDNEFFSAVYPYIFTSKENIESIKEKTDDVYILARLAGEKLQLAEQQNKGGRAHYFWKYISSKSFRQEQELQIATEEMRVYAENYQVYDIESKAKKLSSSKYLWAFNETGAQEALTNIWNGF